MAPTWSSAKTKVQLKLSVQRLRGLQEKKEAQAKSSRRDIATLLEGGKVEKAKVKVENIINEDIHVELLELLELHCELLLARFGLLDQNTREPDPNIHEAVCSVIHAAPKTDLKELHILRELLMVKFGREFAIKVMENRDNCVGDRVMKKIEFHTPTSQLVDAYLTEIARGYNVAWSAPTPPKSIDDIDNDEGDGDGDGGGGLKDTVPSLAIDSKSPVSEKQGSSKTGAVPSVKPKSLPDLPHTESEADTLPSLKSLGTPTTHSPEDDAFTALSKRFAALKSRGDGVV